MTNSQPVRDRFAAPEYCNPHAKLPYIQSLRGEHPGECGFFVNLEQMTKASWVNMPDQLDSYTFSSGAVERGLLLRQPRMLVVPKSALLAARTVKTDSGIPELELLGKYYDYKGRAGVSNVQIFEVLLLDSHNQPLHEIPLQYVAKGATQATFATRYQQLLLQVTMCHAQANGISGRPKNLEFNALCVFEFEVARELAGNNGQKAPACKIVSHTIPTMADWTDFFLGRNDELADRVLLLLGISVSDTVIAAAKPIAQLEPVVELLGNEDLDDNDKDIPF